MIAFTGVVLTGGRSTRMGRDKAMLVVDGRTLLNRAVDLLQRAGAARVLVSGDRPEHGGIPDAVPGIGPVGGIAATLDHAVGEALLVIPVDLPNLDTGTLARLLEALDHASAACCAGHPLPWAARIDSGLHAGVAEALRVAPAGPSMRLLHAAVGGIEIPAPAGRVLSNLNTPADLERLGP